MDILAIDIGNSRTKIGLFADSALRRTWDIATHETSPDDVASLLTSIPAGCRVGISSVVATRTPCWQQHLQHHRCDVTVITGNSPTPLVNRYATPQTLGPDRLMAAVAAVACAGTPVIPVSLGTAIVVDAVSAAGEYLGGMIAPGIRPASDALTQATSALYAVTWEPSTSVIGRSTHDALTNGLHHLMLGGIERMIDATRQALGASAPVVMTGGWASAVAPVLRDPVIVEPFLVLHGIAHLIGMFPTHSPVVAHHITQGTAGVHLRKTEPCE